MGTVTGADFDVHPAVITSRKATAAKQVGCASRALTLSCGTRMSRRRRVHPKNAGLDRRPSSQGYWRGNNFYYNRTVNNVNVTEIHNVYNKTVVNNYTSVNRASFNGPGGVNRKPRPQEETYAREQHTQPTAAQTEHRHAAASDRSRGHAV
jgi:hypothetical protein